MTRRKGFRKIQKGRPGQLTASILDGRANELSKYQAAGFIGFPQEGIRSPPAVADSPTRQAPTAETGTAVMLRSHSPPDLLAKLAESSFTNHPSRLALSFDISLGKFLFL